MSSQPTDPGTPRQKPLLSPRRPSQLVILIIFLLLAAAAIIVYGVRSSARNSAVTGTADPFNTKQVARGQLVYATRCAGCHGAALEGEAGWPQPRVNGTLPASPLNAKSAIVSQTDQAIFLVIKRGGQSTIAAGQTSGMPAFEGGLTDTDIWATIAYIKSTWPSH